MLVKRADVVAGSAMVFALALSALMAWAKPVPPHSATSPWPMFGGSPARNMVNGWEKKAPVDWSVVEGKRKNIKWAVELFSESIGQPVIAHGKVFVAAKSRDSQFAYLAFDEANGALLWQNKHGDAAGKYTGWFSTPAVDEGRLYYIAPNYEVIAADCADGKIQWRLDLVKQCGVAPQNCASCSPRMRSPLVVGNLVYVVTGNARSEDANVRWEEAPSFLALNRKTGGVVWQSNLPGKNIIDGSASCPAFAVVRGMPQVIFPGGDAVLYSFEPNTGKLLWKCDCLPRRRDPADREIDPTFVGSPVIVGDRLYIGLGAHPNSPNHPQASWFFCVDITKRGDVSLTDYDAKAPANKNSALVWAFGGPMTPRPAKGRDEYFGPTISTAAVHDGLVYISEEAGYLHCLDAKTGKRYWQHDFRAGIWGSPFWVDGKIYVGANDGEMRIFAHGKTKQLLASIDMEAQIDTTPAAANGTLFILTRSMLYAIGER
jgi:outer membrane protein assembly factor BamB